MNFKNILKTFSLLSLATIGVAAAKDKINSCDDINSFIKEKKLTSGSYDCEIKEGDYVLDFYDYESSDILAILNKLSTYSNISNLRLWRVGLTEVPKVIGDITSLKSLDVSDNYIKSYPKEIGNLTNLENLISWDTEVSTLPKEIGKLEKLKVINLKNNTVTAIPKEIGNLKKLEYLILENNKLEEVPKEIGNLENLIDLDISYNKLKAIPKEIGNLKSLIRLNLNYNKIKDIPKEVGNMTRLEKLYVSNNELECEIPQSLNDLKYLRIIDFLSNKNLKGKLLKDRNTLSCYYDTEADICYEGDKKPVCIIDEDYNPKKCGDSKTGDEKKDTNVSKDGRCGKDHGNAVCPSGECCSKYGYCGHSSEHCSVDKGCQSKFGQCNTGKATTTIKKTSTKTTTKSSKPTSTDGKCGKDHGNAVCPSGECCSKYGYCGHSNDHCLISKGCQSEFGQCNSGKTTSTGSKTSVKKTSTKSSKPTSTDGRCGKNHGNAVCPSGECCSKYGYCGHSNDHCSSKKGCQSEFGKCN